MVFGYWNNYDEAKQIADHYTTVNKERSYRVINKRVARRDYKNLRSRIAKE